LKALEDPQSHVYYILATTEPQKLLPTIRGRCSIFPVSLLDDGNMMKLLRRVVKAEEASINKNLYYKIIEKSQGHPRNALQILESVLSVSDEQRETILQEMEELELDSIELCRALIKGAGWKTVSELLTKLKKEEPESIRRMVLSYCSTVLLKEENIIAASIMEAMIEPFYNTGFPGLVFACFSVVCTREEE
jgi:DNA polymerase-3 subunit gamma/tau